MPHYETSPQEYCYHIDDSFNTKPRENVNINDYCTKGVSKHCNMYKNVSGQKPIKYDNIGIVKFTVTSIEPTFVNYQCFVVGSFSSPTPIMIKYKCKQDSKTDKNIKSKKQKKIMNRKPRKRKNLVYQCKPKREIAKTNMNSVENYQNASKSLAKIRLRKSPNYGSKILSKFLLLLCLVLLIYKGLLYIIIKRNDEEKKKKSKKEMCCQIMSMKSIYCNAYVVWSIITSEVIYPRNVRFKVNYPSSNEVALAA